MGIKKFAQKGLRLGAIAATALLLAACGTDEAQETTNENGNVQIEELSIGFVPSRQPDEILTQTEPLKELLTEEMAGLGYDIENIDITVGTSYEAVGEALSAGTTDIGFIPGGTYVIYADDANPILTATRYGLSNDSEDPTDWNANKPTENTEDEVTYYKALIYAGPSEKGRELAEKVNNGEELSWDDISSANWGVMGPSSSAGFIYPYMWLQENYDGNNINDLNNTVQMDSYGTMMGRLASGQIDIAVGFADARLDYADQWEDEFGAENDIWSDTDVIGVTDNIMNDTISVSRFSDIMTDEFNSALQEAFINIGNTPEGQEVISIYSHIGYEPATPEDYETAVRAQEIIREYE